MKELEDILGASNVKYNEPMSKHTSFKVGGNADIFITVDSQEKLLKVLDFATNNKFAKDKQTWQKVDTYNENKENTSEQSLPITIVGNGTNLLVKDGGIRGLVIKYIANNYFIVDSNNANIEEKESKTTILGQSQANKEDENYFVTISSGMTNALLAKILLDNSLSGFEFAGGIPGTIGGAIYMNAGAYGKEMKDIMPQITAVRNRALLEMQRGNTEGYEKAMQEASELESTLKAKGLNSTKALDAQQRAFNYNKTS